MCWRELWGASADQTAAGGGRAQVSRGCTAQRAGSQGEGLCISADKGFGMQSIRQQSGLIIYIMYNKS